VRVWRLQPFCGLNLGIFAYVPRARVTPKRPLISGVDYDISERLKGELLVD